MPVLRTRLTHILFRGETISQITDAGKLQRLEAYMA